MPCGVRATRSPCLPSPSAQVEYAGYRCVGRAYRNVYPAGCSERRAGCVASVASQPMPSSSNKTPIGIPCTHRLSFRRYVRTREYTVQLSSLPLALPRYLLKNLTINTRLLPRSRLRFLPDVRCVVSCAAIPQSGSRFPSRHPRSNLSFGDDTDVRAISARTSVRIPP